jgi:hypothetical protein
MQEGHLSDREVFILHGSRSEYVEGKSPCGQVDLLLRARLLTLKTEDAYHGH